MFLNVAAGTEAGGMEGHAAPIACCQSAANHASRPTGPADGRPGVIADDADGPDMSPMVPTMSPTTPEGSRPACAEVTEPLSPATST